MTLVRKYAVTLLFLLPFCSMAQEISGVWLGEYEKGKELRMELHLHDDSLISGTRIQYYSNDRYEAFAISGIFKKRDSTVFIREDSALNQTADGFGDKGTYNLVLSVHADKMVLKGKWKNSGESWFTSMSSKVRLEKELKIAHKPRKQPLQVVETIEADASDVYSIRIELRDYERADNDVISLYLNDSLVLYEHQLSSHTKAVDLKLEPEQTAYILRMVAESQGVIPPCTAEITIITARKRHVFTLTSNSNKDEGIAIKVK